MSNPSEIDPIDPEEARQRLDAALAPYLEDGWEIRSEHDYMARLTRGGHNLDFYVDLLGEVRVEDKALTPGQDSGRLVAWLFLLLTFFLVIALASALGWLR